MNYAAIDDLFHERSMYHHAELVETIGDARHWYEYVTADALFLIANWTQVVAAWGVRRWRDWTPEDWRATLEALPPVHTAFHVFQDDVVLLTESRHYWWILYIDCDTSDGRFGKIPKDHFALAEVRQRIECWGADQFVGEIPADKLHGWFSW